MVALEHLDVSHNSLHHLAPQLSSLVRLTHLEASDNKLHQSTAVPEELVTLTALKVSDARAHVLQGAARTHACRPADRQSCRAQDCLAARHAARSRRACMLQA